MFDSGDLSKEFGQVATWIEDKAKMLSDVFMQAVHWVGDAIGWNKDSNSPTNTTPHEPVTRSPYSPSPYSPSQSHHPVHGHPVDQEERERRERQPWRREHERPVHERPRGRPVHGL